LTASTPRCLSVKALKKLVRRILEELDQLHAHDPATIEATSSSAATPARYQALQLNRTLDEFLA
jgi:hypothetical protein